MRSRLCALANQLSVSRSRHKPVRGDHEKSQVEKHRRRSVEHLSRGELNVSR